MATKIQLKRPKTDLTDEQKRNILLAKGEPFIDTNKNKLYVGDGEKSLAELPQIGAELTAENICKVLNNDTEESNKISAKKIDASEVAVENATNAVKVTQYIGDKSIIGDIFENDGVTVKKATRASQADNAKDVTESINGEDLSNIFESNGTTVKNATRIANGNKSVDTNAGAGHSGDVVINATSNTVIQSGGFVISEAMVGTTLPSNAVKGQIFFLVK